MSTLHLEFIRDDVSLVRWYDSDGQEGFDKRLPYKAIATLLWQDKGVEICGLHGEMTRSMWKDLRDELLDRGVQAAFAHRHGQWVEWYLTSEGCSTQRNRATGV